MENISSIIKVLLTKIANEKVIPIDISTSNFKTREQLEKELTAILEKTRRAY